MYVKLKSNGNGDFITTYASAPAGTIGAIGNMQSFPIVLIADDRLGAGCAPTGNVVLDAKQTTTAAQLAALYGTSNVRSPKTITACAPSAPAKTPLLDVVLTFLAGG